LVQVQHERAAIQGELELLAPVLLAAGENNELQTNTSHRKNNELQTTTNFKQQRTSNNELQTTNFKLRKNNQLSTSTAQQTIVKHTNK